MMKKRKHLNKIIRVPQNTKTLMELDILRNVAYVQEINAEHVSTLKSLKGCPPEVCSLDCYHTAIQSLEHGPKKARIIFCDRAINLTSLKGCPDRLTKLDCSMTQLKTLKYGPKHVEELRVNRNPQLILDQVWKDIQNCTRYHQAGLINISSGLLGLLRIRNLKLIGPNTYDLTKPLQIISKYVPVISMSSIMQCRQELIDSGLETYAHF